MARRDGCRDDHRRASARARLALAAMAVVGFLGFAAPVAAHAELLESDPAANATLPAAPARLTLRFTEAIDPATARVQLLDRGGDFVASVGDVEVGEDPATVTVELPALEPGVYTVSYQVVSAVDGHATAGSFAFLVDPTGTEPPPTGGVTSTAPAADALAVAARWVALAGGLVALGSLVFWLRVGGRMALRDASVPWPLVAGAALTAFVGLVAYLALAARPIVAAAGHPLHDQPGRLMFDFAAPFGWTPFAIAMRVALLGSLLAFALAIGRHFARGEVRRHGRQPTAGSDRRLALATGALAAIALLGMSLAGHAASIGGPAFGLLDWAHLLAAGAWLGPIPAFAVLARRPLADGATRAGVLGTALRGHSRLALVAAPLVALTGIANSPLVLGSSRELVASAYGNLLLAKALLFSVALAIGAANHFLVRGRTLRRVAPLLAAELGVAALAVGVAATMVTVPPASSRQPVLSSTAIGAAHLYGEAGASSVHVAITLPSPGSQRYQVVVADAETGAPHDDVQRVFLTFVPPPGSGLAPERVELEVQEPEGLYGAVGAYTPIEGEWTIEAIVRRAGELDQVATFSVPVADPLPPRLVPPPDTGVGVPAPLAALWSVLPSAAGGWLPAIMLLGALVVASGAMTGARRRGRGVPGWLRVAAPVLTALLVVAGLAAGSRALVQAANRVPLDAATAANPLPVEPAAIERGERIYVANCAGCHGTGGAGDGPTAVGMLPAPAPLADTVPRLTDGELAYRVTNGLAGTPMPAFAATLSESDRWELVHYLRDRWGAADD